MLSSVKGSSWTLLSDCSAARCPPSIWLPETSQIWNVFPVQQKTLVEHASFHPSPYSVSCPCSKINECTKLQSLLALVYIWAWWYTEIGCKQMSKTSCLQDFMLHGVDVSGKNWRGLKQLLTGIQIPCILKKAVPKCMNKQG